MGNTAASTRKEMTRGSLDRVIGWLPDLDAGFHQRRLFWQRDVFLMARGHALVLAEGTGHDRVEAVLREQGLQRALPLPLQVPHFLAVPWIVSETDFVVSVPQRLAEKVAPALGLVARALPLALPTFEVNLFWHQRVHGNPGHRGLRERLAQLCGRADVRTCGRAAGAGPLNARPAA